MATVATFEDEYLVQHTIHAGREFVVKYIPTHDKGYEYDIALRESILNDFIGGLSMDAIKIGVARRVKDLSVVEE